MVLPSVLCGRISPSPRLSELGAGEMSPHCSPVSSVLYPLSCVVCLVSSVLCPLSSGRGRETRISWCLRAALQVFVGAWAAAVLQVDALPRSLLQPQSVFKVTACSVRQASRAGECSVETEELPTPLQELADYTVPANYWSLSLLSLSLALSLFL